MVSVCRVRYEGGVGYLEIATASLRRRVWPSSWTVCCFLMVFCSSLNEDKTDLVYSERPILGTSLRWSQGEASPMIVVVGERRFERAARGENRSELFTVFIGTHLATNVLDVSIED